MSPVTAVYIQQSEVGFEILSAHLMRAARSRHLAAVLPPESVLTVTTRRDAHQACNYAN
jgi:hypothetical protein